MPTPPAVERISQKPTCAPKTRITLCQHKHFHFHLSGVVRHHDHSSNSQLGAVTTGCSTPASLSWRPLTHSLSHSSQGKRVTSLPPTALSLNSFKNRTPDSSFHNPHLIFRLIFVTVGDSNENQLFTDTGLKSPIHSSARC